MADDWAQQSILDRMVMAVERVRDRLRRATAAFEAAGVPYAVVGGNAAPAPDVAQAIKPQDFRVIPLEELVRMKLAAFQLNDKVDVRDMLDVGFIDSTWIARLPAELANRLQLLIDSPEG